MPRIQLLAPILGLIFCLPVAFGFNLHAQTRNWRAEMEAAQQAAQEASRAGLPLARYVRQWRSEIDSTGRSLLIGREQAEWAQLMAALNRSLQNVLAFSDDYETARRLAIKDFAKWSGNRNEEEAVRDQLRLLVQLLDCDRAAYTLTDSLRAAAGNSATISHRLNEGNRSFGLQYGIFAKMNADFFDAARRHRTRSRYAQIARQKDFLEMIKSEEPEIYLAAQRLLAEPALRKIAQQSDASILWENSLAALVGSIDLAQQIGERTFHNGSQFFGNLVGDNLFRLADLVGIGESRGHDVPALLRYYPDPQGREFSVHPVQAAAMEQRLTTGDILFEKARFTITDKLIPGYFGHVAIYLKNYAALRELGVLDTEEMRQATNGMAPADIEAQLGRFAAELETIPEKEEWLKLAIMRRRLALRNFNGAPVNPFLFEALYRLKYKNENVLEALRDGQTIAAYEGGVTLNSFQHFLYVDDFAAIRLKRAPQDSLYQQNLARFLALALLQYGKPYDFRFDVNTLDAIVCSELIYQSFVGVEFGTGESLSSFTISPDQVAQEAGYPTTLGALRLEPAFAPVQWYAEAMPLYPSALLHEEIAPDSSFERTSIADTLLQRVFMVMVREELGGLQLLSGAQTKEFEAYRELAQKARAMRSAKLRETPAAFSSEAIVHDRTEERRLQNLFITLDQKTNPLSRPAVAQEESAFVQQAVLEKSPASPAPTTLAQQQERAAALAEVFRRWQEGAAYRLDYDAYYSGKEKFFLAVFRGARVMDDGGFGRGLDLQLAGNNEAPRRAQHYLQYYSFLPFHLQVFDNSGKVVQRWQGGASLASIRRSFLQGDHLHMQALAWRSTAYASTFTPLTMEAGGDKGPLSAVLKLMTIGNGNYQSGWYAGERAGITLAAYETRASRRAFTLLELKYGGKVQVTLGKLRCYSRGALGARIGTFSERKNQAAKVDFPEIREWAFGVEVFGSSLYRPAIHRLEFSVSEDDARFIGGEIKKDRQVRIAYSWSLSE